MLRSWLVCVQNLPKLTQICCTDLYRTKDFRNCIWCMSSRDIWGNSSWLPSTNCTITFNCCTRDKISQEGWPKTKCGESSESRMLQAGIKTALSEKAKKIFLLSLSNFLCLNNSWSLKTKHLMWPFISERGFEHFLSDPSCFWSPSLCSQVLLKDSWVCVKYNQPRTTPKLLHNKKFWFCDSCHE